MDGTHAIASAWNTFSSRNYKKDIEPLTDEDYRDALTKILKTPVFRYRYRREPEQAKQRIGLIAEESPAEISDGDSIGLMRYIDLLHAALKAQHKELQKVKKGLCGQKRRD